MIYLLHGEDAFSISETTSGLRARMREEDSAGDLNTSQLDGRRLTVGELEAEASALPFLGERRLVIVHGLVGRCDPQSGDGARAKLAEDLPRYLANVPDTTRLVFAEGKLARNNPILKWCLSRSAENADAVVVRDFESPKPGTLPGWLQRRASGRGGQIESRAAQALADALVREGSVDLRLADAEVEKLITYAAGETITVAMVERLVTPVSLESIFKFTDALADRDARTASSLLHRFLAEGEHPLRILALVARQVRLLARTKSLVESGVPPSQLPGKLPVPPFVARKLGQQAGRFSLPFLTAAIQRLAEIDTDIKTGETDAALALDLFVAGMCGVTGVEPSRSGSRAASKSA